MLASKWRQDLLLNDSLWYSAQAVKLAAGDGFVDPFYGGPSAEHGPLTPLLVAPVSWMDDPVPWQRAVMTVIGLAVVVGVGLLARRVAGWWAGVTAAALAAVYPNLWMNDSLVMSEAPAALLVVLALWLALDLVDPDQPPTAARATLLWCRDRAGEPGAQRARPAGSVAGDRRVVVAARRRRCETPAHGCPAVERHRCRARSLGRGQPGSLRAPGAADDERRHHAARCQLSGRLLRFRHRRVVIVLCRRGAIAPRGGPWCPFGAPSPAGDLIRR